MLHAGSHQGMLVWPDRRDKGVDEVLRDRTTLSILKSTAYCICLNSHTRLALDHNSALLLLLQSHNLQHRRRLPY